MDTLNSYSKISEPKVVDAVNVGRKYIDASTFKSKLITASATSVFLAAVVAFLVFFF